MDEPVAAAQHRIRLRQEAMRGFQGTHAEWNALRLSDVPAGPDELFHWLKVSEQALASAIEERGWSRSVVMAALADAVLLGFYLAAESSA